jgi:hypothetical protein
LTLEVHCNGLSRNHDGGILLKRKQGTLERCGSRLRLDLRAFSLLAAIHAGQVSSETVAFMSNLAFSRQAPLHLPPNNDDDDRTQSTVQQDLTAVLESYASLYPNPRLASERQERESLIRALAAADEATQRNPPAARGGFLRRLWGGSSRRPDVAEDAVVQNFDARRLKYVAPDDDDDNEAALCGTEHYSLDLSCIPPEAYAAARFRMASRHRRTNVARTAWERGGVVVVLIAGLGQLAQVPSEDRPNAPPTLSSTSDRAGLEDYVHRHGLSFSTERARACMIGPFFLMVSWGLPDGIVICYRKVHRPDSSKQTMVGWQAVARVGPTKAVQSNLADIFNEEESNGFASSPLLTPTDLVPLVVETEPDSVPDSSVAIARLGGYIEIFPLPSRLWYGPEVAAKKNSRLAAKSHYAASLPDLISPKSTGSRVAAITTLDYHDDIMGLEAFRTRVRPDTVWDQETYPDRPPAEFVLIAHGCDPATKTEQLSFWAVSTLFTESPDQKGDVNFSLHTTLAEAIDLGPLIPPAILFASDTVLEYWRKPRRVELLDSVDGSGDDSIVEDRVTTISIPTPLMALSTYHSGEVTLLTILDGFGGVALLNCSLLERLVSQCLSIEEREQIFSPSDTSPSVPLADFLCERTHVSRTLSGSLGSTTDGPLQIADVQFLPRRLAAAVANDKPVLGLLTQGVLYILSVQDLRRGQPPSSIEIAGGISKPGQLHVRSRNEVYVLLNGNVAGSVQPFVLSSLLDGHHLVERLIREGKDMEAVEAAESLNAVDGSRLKDQLILCRRRLWEEHAHVESLVSSTDLAYQVEQALAASEGKLEAVNSAVSPFSIVRSALKFTLEMLPRVSFGSAVAIGGNEGVNAVVAKLRNRFILLGTYEVLSLHLGVTPVMGGFVEDFLPLSVAELARTFAMQGNIEAVSIVYYRHASEMNSEIIQAIPVSVDPFDYQHLIPVILHGDDEVVRFISGSENTSLEEFSFLDSYLFETFGLSVCIDEEERTIIAEATESLALTQLYKDEETLGSVLVDRLDLIQNSSGSLELTLEFCNVALKALRAIAPSVTDREPLKQLWKLQSESICLQSLLAKFSQRDSQLLRFSTMNTGEFENVEMSELIDSILSSGLVPADIRALIDEQVRPKISPSTASVDNDLDLLLSESCSRIVSSTSDAGEESFIERLACVASVCSLSSSVVDKRQRLLKNRGCLVDSVIGAINEVLRLWGHAELSYPCAGRVVDIFWSMYECLPDAFSCDRGSGEPDSTTDIDYYRLLLIVGDIASKWLGCNALALMRQGFPVSGRRLGGEHRDAIVKDLCQSFLQQIGSEQSGEAAERKRSLLSLLIGDIEEIISISDDETQSESLTTELFLPLLNRTEIPLLRYVLVNFGTKHFQRDQIQDALISFTDDAVFSTEGGENLEAAIACEDAFAGFFPQLQPHFASIRQCLNVAHFINSVLFSSTDDYMKPELVKESAALDVVEYVLSTCPGSVLKDTEEWGDEVFGVGANGYLRAKEEAFEQSGPLLAPPPRLPGVAIFHLAELLELIDEPSVIAVKGLVIQGCIRCKHFGAASAICRTLLVGKGIDSSRGRAILTAVSCVVQEPLYADTRTRLEICLKALIILSSNTFSTAEDQCHLSSMSSQFRVLSNDAAAEDAQGHFLGPRTASGFDISGSLGELSQQSTQTELDEGLLESVARDIIGACVSKSDHSNAPISQVEGDALLVRCEMGLSLLLHSQSSDRAVSFLNKVHGALNSNIFKRGLSGSSRSTALPSEAILRKLVGRGYSENGARRAVLSTQGQGFDETLRWAVTNSLEPGFDEPLVILKDTEVLMDHGCFRLMSSKIDAALDALSGKIDLFEPSTYTALPSKDVNPAYPQTAHRSLQVATGKSRPTVAISSKPTIPAPNDINADFDLSSNWEGNDSAEAKGFRSGDTVDETSKNDHLESIHDVPESVINQSDRRVEKEELLAPVSSHDPSLDAGPSQKSHLRIKTPAHSAPKQEKSLESTGSVPRDLPNSLKVAATSQPPAQRMIPSGTSAESDRTSSHKWKPNRSLVAPGLSITKPSGQPLSKFNPASPQDPVARSELRRMGRAALDSVRTATSPGHDDRHRLIEEGRRLLQLSRRGPTGTPNVPPPLRKLQPPSPPRAVPGQKAEKSRVTRVSFGPPSYHLPQQDASISHESAIVAPNPDTRAPNEIPPVPKAPIRPPPAPSYVAKAPPPPAPPKSPTQESNGWDFNASVEEDLEADTTNDAWGFGDEEDLASNEDLGEEKEEGWGFDDDI